MAELQDSILNTIKDLCGPGAEHEFFDSDIISAINTELMYLNQLGIGPAKPFTIHGSEETWGDFLGENLDVVQPVVDTIKLRVTLLFDPPTSSFVLSSHERQLSEAEWRLNMMYEAGELNPS